MKKLSLLPFETAEIAVVSPVTPTTAMPRPSATGACCIVGQLGLSEDSRIPEEILSLL